MDVLDTIRTVLAVRTYQDTPVPDDVVTDILEAARLTASGMNRQTWDFIVVQGKDALAELAAGTHGHGAYVADAAFAVVVATEPSPMGLANAARAIQSMVLTAWSHGVGSNWTGFSGMLGDVATSLGVPADREVVAVVPFGYPVDSIGKGKKNRKPLAEIVHWGHWGVHEQP